jgi:hypothetical protein
MLMVSMELGTPTEQLPRGNSMAGGGSSRRWLGTGLAAVCLVAVFLLWRVLSGPSDDTLVWQAMQQTHRQVNLPDGAFLVERQATEPGLWSRICFGVTTGCPRDERTYTVDEYPVSAQLVSNMLAGIPITDVQQQCPAAGSCRVSGTVTVNDQLSFVLEVRSPRHGGDTSSVVGVSTTPRSRSED